MTALAHTSESDCRTRTTSEHYTANESWTRTKYGYDNIYELLTATQGASTTESYNYDPVGNRQSNLSGSGWSNNTSNELTSRPGVTYTYDNNGNTLTKTDSTGTTNYTWDFENRLTSVTLPGSGGTVSFKYDPFGRRIYKSSSSGTSIYAYDGDDLTEETSATGAIVARYTQGPHIDEPLAMLRSATTSYYQADGLGSITSLTNSSGAVASNYTYDSFGSIIATSGSLTNSLRYTGREFDTETNVYYYRARYYDAAAGRFLTEDRTQFFGGINFYRYVTNSPTNLFDPFGLKDYNGQQTTDLFLTPAYNDATAGFFKGLLNIRDHSQGGGDYDFAHNLHSGDTFVRCGLTMSAGDFGNYIAGFQAGAWDSNFYGNGWRSSVRYAEGAAYVAGIYYHASGQSDVPNDRLDKTGRPLITLGADDGRTFDPSKGKCGCK
jgi:RHS repeat-associated protein